MGDRSCSGKTLVYKDFSLNLKWDQAQQVGSRQKRDHKQENRQIRRTSPLRFFRMIAIIPPVTKYSRIAEKLPGDHLEVFSTFDLSIVDYQ